MHPCLHIDEILEQVVHSCSSSEADLARLGRVCRAFYEPAMDALWAHTPFAIEKLLLCLPTDAINTKRSWVYLECPDYTPSLCSGVTRALLPHEWTRFSHHARRVKSISLSEMHVDNYSLAFSESNQAATSYLEALRHRFHGQCIFPRLQELTIHELFEPYLDLFLRPELGSCHVENSPEETMGKIFQRLGMCATSLNTLIITFPRGRTSAATQHQQATLLELCTKLKDLTTHTPILPSTLVVLASSRRLRSLRLQLSLPIIHVNDIRPLRSLAFADLTTLSLESPVEHLQAFLHIAYMPCVRNVELIVSRYWQRVLLPQPSVFSLNLLIESVAGLISIRKLALRLTGDGSELGLNTVISSESLLPLTALFLLESLEIDCPCVDMQPRHIPRMASAWPHMQHLTLAGSDPWTYSEADNLFRPSICIEDLYPFAQHCPLLHHLAVHVSGEIAPFAPVYDAEVPIAHANMSELHLTDSYLSEGWERARVARFVVTVFPAVGASAGVYARIQPVEREIRSLLLEDTALLDTVDLRANH